MKNTSLLAIGMCGIGTSAGVCIAFAPLAALDAQRPNQPRRGVTASRRFTTASCLLLVDTILVIATSVFKMCSLAAYI